MLSLSNCLQWFCLSSPHADDAEKTEVKSSQKALEAGKTISQANLVSQDKTVTLESLAHRVKLRDQSHRIQTNSSFEKTQSPVEDSKRPTILWLLQQDKIFNTAQDQIDSTPSKSPSPPTPPILSMSLSSIRRTVEIPRSLIIKRDEDDAEYVQTVWNISGKAKPYRVFPSPRHAALAKKRKA